MSRLFRLRFSPGRKASVSSLDGKVWIRQAARQRNNDGAAEREEEAAWRFEIRDAHNYARLLKAASRMQRRPPFFWHALVVSSLIYLSIAMFITFLATASIFSSSPNKARFLVDGNISQEKSPREFLPRTLYVHYIHIIQYNCRFIYFWL